MELRFITTYDKYGQDSQEMLQWRERPEDEWTFVERYRMSEEEFEGEE